MAERAETPGGEFVGIANPAQRALADAGITTLEQLSRRTAKELLALHGMGPKAIRQLREAMVARNLRFADE